MRSLLLSLSFCFVSTAAMAEPISLTCNATSVLDGRSTALQVTFDREHQTAQVRVDNQTFIDNDARISATQIRADVRWTEITGRSRRTYRYHRVQIDRVTGALTVTVRRYSGAGAALLAHRGTCERSTNARF